MWNKKFVQADRKKFLHLIEYIIQSIDAGVLKAGEPLPTQRELSKKLNLSIGTITKAFKELEKLGYLSGEIGRGTFVKDITRDYSDFWYSEKKVPYKFNLGHFRTTELFNHTIQLNLLSGIKEVTNSNEIYFKLNDIDNCGSNAQKETFINYVKPLGFNSIDISNISILSSEVSSINIVINALTEPGDSVIIEEISDRITNDQLTRNNRNVVTVKMDLGGISPEDLERILKTTKAKLLITMATFHNPTTTTTKKERKDKIAAICQKYNTLILEDGKVDKFYDDDVYPYYELAPNNALYTSGMYFTINPAINSSFIIGDESIIKKIESAFKLYQWSSSQLLVEIASNLIQENRVEKIINEKKKLLKRRNKIYNEIFGLDGSIGHSFDVIKWLKLPNHWSSSEFTQTAYENGLLVRNSNIFNHGSNENLPYVRICNGAIHDEGQYKLALTEIKSLFDEYPLEV